MSTEIATIPTTGIKSRTDTGSSGLDRLSAMFNDLVRSPKAPTIGRVLLLWREAERDLEAATPGSEAWAGASERCLIARSEYQRMFALAALGTEDLRSLW